MNPARRYLFNLFKALNRLVNTLLGGHPEVPLSARAGYWAAEGIRTWPARLINAVFRDPEHTARAYEKEDDTLLHFQADPRGRLLVPLGVLWASLVGLAVWAHL